MKRSSKPIPKDSNQLAYAMVKFHTEELSEPAEPEAIEQPPERSAVSQYLAEIGRKGGLKGGKARADKLTPERGKRLAGLLLLRGGRRKSNLTSAFFLDYFNGCNKEGNNPCDYYPLILWC